MQARNAKPSTATENRARVKRATDKSLCKAASAAPSYMSYLSYMSYRAAFKANQLGGNATPSCAASVRFQENKRSARDGHGSESRRSER